MAVTFVQRSGSKAASSSTVDATYGSAVASGNLLIALVHWGGSGQSLNSVTDSAGNTWTLIAGTYASVSATHFTYMRSQIAYTTSGSVATPTVTATFSSAPSFVWIDIYEATAGQLDVYATATGNSATPTSGSVTASADSFAVAGGNLDNGFGFGSGWFTAGSGWTLGYETGEGNYNAFGEYRSSSGSVNGTCNSNYSAFWGGWTACIATFKPVSSGTSIPVLMSSYRKRRT